MTPTQKTEAQIRKDKKASEIEIGDRVETKCAGRYHGKVVDVDGEYALVKFTPSGDFEPFDGDAQEIHGNDLYVLET